MKRKILIIILLVTIRVISPAQKLASFEINIAAPTNGLDQPTSVNLDNISFVPDSMLSLVEVINNKRQPVPFQITQAKHRTLHWMIHSANGNTKKRLYELVKTKPLPFAQINATRKDGSLTIQADDKNLLRYWFSTVYPPSGIDTVFKRSAFIHPLWTPHGQELTRIQPPDHYHHYGIWNPWTHVLFEGDTLDFWNLKAKTGTVRFGKLASVTNGAIFSEFTAMHEHIAFKKDNTEKVALNELQTVRVYRPEKNQDYFYVDITIEMNCATDSPFEILEYRYAGLGWRTTEKWKKENSQVLSSEGMTRKDVDGTRARWCIIEGALDNDYGGAVMMSYPSNYNYPEPMRIWPDNSNQGEIFAMFAPTKNTNWLLQPGKVYTLNYRFVVFNGKFSKEKAESAWTYFATPPTVITK